MPVFNTRVVVCCPAQAEEGGGELPLGEVVIEGPDLVLGALAPVAEPLEPLVEVEAPDELPAA